MSWPLIKLGEVAQVNPRLPKDVDSTQEVIFLPMAAISEQGQILEQEKRILSETRKGFTYFEKNDVVVAKITPCFENGKAAFLDCLETQIGFGTTEFHVIRPNIEKLDGKYLFYLVWNKWFRHLGERNMSGSAGQKRVPTDFLKSLEIPLPPLDEQKRIAAILDKTDTIRRKRQQAIQLADDLLRSVFLDMFGDPVTNPKGWEVKTVIDVSSSKLQNGAYYPKGMYNPAGTEMVHMGDAFYDYVPRGKMKRVLVTDKDLQKYCLTSNDILISRRSLNYEGAAKPSLISESEDHLIFESSLIRLSPDQDVIDKLYLFSYLSNEKVKKHKVRQFVTGATIKGISQKNLEKVNVVLPPLDLQKKYAQIFRKVETLKNSFSYSKQNKLFESLSHKAFAGKL